MSWGFCLLQDIYKVHVFFFFFSVILISNPWYCVCVFLLFESKQRKEKYRGTVCPYWEDCKAHLPWQHYMWLGFFLPTHDVKSMRFAILYAKMADFLGTSNMAALRRWFCLSNDNINGAEDHVLSSSSFIFSFIFW